MTKTPSEEPTQSGGKGQLTRDKHMGRFISAYSVDIDLSELRKAFEARASTEHAQYTQSGSYEAATDLFRAVNENSEYRLNVQLKDRGNLTFHLTVGLQKPRGNNLQSGSLLRFANGLRLASSDGTAIDRPFGRSLEVTVNALHLQSDVYTATLYKA